MWLLQLYNKGNEAEGKPETKLDIDYSKIAALTFTFQVNEEDKELWDGTIGGSVVFSCNGEKLGVQNDEDPAKAALFDKYNWPSCEFWGVLDEELLGPDLSDEPLHDPPKVFAAEAKKRKIRVEIPYLGEIVTVFHSTAAVCFSGTT